MTTATTVTALPPLDDAPDGATFDVVDDAGLFWGRHKAVTTWTGERTWVSSTDA